jgi:catechol 2,3-dioxygenase-like lactoylglutathione lyase family enzyme
VDEVRQTAKGHHAFFVVEDVSSTIDFYTRRLGFTVNFQQTIDGDDSPSFCILGRDNIAIMFKAILPGIRPTPNAANHSWARWDAYVTIRDPDGLFEEFKGRGVEFHRELEDTADGLRAFEVKDNSGYVLCFGRRV